MAIEGEHKRIVDRLAELTEQGKLQWKPTGGRWIIAEKGDWEYMIHMNQAKTEFSVKIYEGEKLLMRVDAAGSEYSAFYATAAAQEPVTSILKGLEGE